MSAEKIKLIGPFTIDLKIRVVLEDGRLATVTRDLALTQELTEEELKEAFSSTIDELNEGMPGVRLATQREFFTSFCEENFGAAMHVPGCDDKTNWITGE